MNIRTKRSWSTKETEQHSQELFKSFHSTGIIRHEQLFNIKNCFRLGSGCLNPFFRTVFAAISLRIIYAVRRFPSYCSPLCVHENRYIFRRGIRRSAEFLPLLLFVFAIVRRCADSNMADEIDSSSPVLGNVNDDLADVCKKRGHRKAVKLRLVPDTCIIFRLAAAKI